MPTPTFTEAPISQIPALQLLQKLGFTYLSPEEVAVERRGKTQHVLLENILTAQLKRMNRFTVKGRELEFSEDSIAKAVDLLREPLYDQNTGHAAINHDTNL